MRYAMEDESGFGDGGIEWQPKTDVEAHQAWLRQHVGYSAANVVEITGIPYGGQADGQIIDVTKPDSQRANLPA